MGHRYQSLYSLTSKMEISLKNCGQSKNQITGPSDQVCGPLYYTAK
jgi:hypothetical protein